MVGYYSKVSISLLSILDLEYFWRLLCVIRWVVYDPIMVLFPGEFVLFKYLKIRKSQNKSKKEKAEDVLLKRSNAGFQQIQSSLLFFKWMLQILNDYIC